MEEEELRYKEELLSLLNQKKYQELRDYMSEMQEADIAYAMDDMAEEERLRLFRILPKTMAADVFPLLDVDIQRTIITSLSTNEAANIIDNLYADDATAILRKLFQQTFFRCRYIVQFRQDDQFVALQTDDELGSIHPALFRNDGLVAVMERHLTSLQLRREASKGAVVHAQAAIVAAVVLRPCG